MEAFQFGDEEDDTEVIMIRIRTGEDECMNKKIQGDILQNADISQIEELVAAYRELWEAVENGTVDKNFFELRERFRHNMSSNMVNIQLDAKNTEKDTR